MVMNRIQVNNHTVDPSNTDTIRLTTTCAGIRIFEASGILLVGVAVCTRAVEQYEGELFIAVRWQERLNRG